MFPSGATELFGASSAMDLNMPVYGGEVQIPSLGVDLQCVDSKGNFFVFDINAENIDE